MNEPLLTVSPLVLKAVIVDDEELGRCILQDLLREYCPHIDVVGTADSAKQARALIAATNPDVVFLDIRMPGEDGFQLLESLMQHHLLVVFVTAYNQYALRAIKASAVDYLLKPVKITELRETEQRLLRHATAHKSDQANREMYQQLVQTLVEGMQVSNDLSRKISLRHAKGFDFVAMKDIVRLEADRNYTIVYLNTQRRIVVSRPLSEFESMLNMDVFVRVHKSHIINLNYMSGYVCEEAGYAIMPDDTRIEISRRRLHTFFEKVNKFVYPSG